MRPAAPLRAVPDLDALPPLRLREIHGHRRAYRVAGEGRAILLVHGIGDDSRAWAGVVPRLARDHTVIAPDLLGHGGSAKPRGDYSLGGFANGLRDLLSVLDVDRVTVVGHSLGAGVAMQFAYQFPERCERLVLVSAGGVGHEVHLALRALSLPLTAVGLGVLDRWPVRWGVHRVVDLLRRSGTAVGVDAEDLLRVLEALPDATSRAAFVRTLRAVVDRHGQVVTMLDRSYLALGMPTLLVWGDRDVVVPVEHAAAAQQALPGSRLEVFPGAGHFPFRSDPGRFVETLEAFVAETRPARWDASEWRSLLRRGRG
ncbi:alpha/beta fold hydrolase [Nitriliruptoraceae bacterium ZYF776]|nr:alpha/beta fold hydrolase [Profundirhabdus halotolerans]